MPTAPTRWCSKSIPTPAPCAFTDGSSPTTVAPCSSRRSSTGRSTAASCRASPDALNRQLVYDRNGQLLTATLMEYALATATDAPATFEIQHPESPSPLNPLGA